MMDVNSRISQLQRSSTGLASVMFFLLNFFWRFFYALCLGKGKTKFVADLSISTCEKLCVIKADRNQRGCKTSEM